MEDRQLKYLETVFKALANRRRLAILRFIKKRKEATVGAIAEEIKLSFKSTSRHLSVLYSSGLLDKEQRSIEVYYKFAKNLNRSTKEIIITIL